MIFTIIGCFRSGTTMLRHCLARHPQITACFDEIDSYQLYAKAQSAGGMETSGTTGYKIPRFTGWIKDPRFIGFNIVVPHVYIERDPRGVVASMRHLITAENETYLDRIAGEVAAWPSRKLIPDHWKRGAEYPSAVERAAFFWKMWTDAVRSCTPDEGWNIHKLTYENLVRFPEAELRKVCSFLGLAFDPAVLHPEDEGKGKDPNGWFIGQNFPRPISTHSISRWQETLTAAEAEAILRVVGPLTPG